MQLPHLVRLEHKYLWVATLGPRTEKQSVLEDCRLDMAPIRLLSLGLWLSAVLDASHAQGGIPLDLGKMMGGGGGKGASCAFKCANGVPPRPRQEHVPTFNGCGVPGFQVESQYGMTECCNQHDVCYHTCKTDKDRKRGQEICDAAFEKCMLARCATVKEQDRSGCEGEANMMSSGVRMFGCGAYESSQAEACTCDLDPNDTAVQALSEKDRLAMLRAFYAKHDSTKPQGTFLSQSGGMRCSADL